MWRNKGPHRVNYEPCLFLPQLFLQTYTVSKWLTVLDSPSALSKPLWNITHFNISLPSSCQYKDQSLLVYVCFKLNLRVLNWQASSSWLLTCRLDEWEKDCHLFPGINYVWVCTFLFSKRKLWLFRLKWRDWCHFPTVMDMRTSNQALWSS